MRTRVRRNRVLTEDEVAEIARRDIERLAAMVGREAVEHSMRFRRVSNLYPLTVTYAYGGDIARAAMDSDEQIAATVAEWERGQGLVLRDWYAIGRDEGRD